MAALALLAGEHVQPSGLGTQRGRRPSQPHSSRRSLRSKASPPLSALHATVQRYAALCSSDRLVLSRRRQVAPLIMPPGYCWPDGLATGREVARRLRTVTASTAPHTTVTTSPPPAENRPIRRFYDCCWL
jgi:hypothetical protein